MQSDIGGTESPQRTILNHSHGIAPQRRGIAYAAVRLSQAAAERKNGMEVKENGTVGSLQIATEVLGKIARQAALEIEGVAAVENSTGGVRGAMMSRIQKPVTVVMTDGVAEISINVQVHYGARIPTLCEHVQENVKTSVQNMTGVTVSRVNVVVAGISPEQA
jgi:uncharacterized alkaline shock family protein YloU